MRELRTADVFKMSKILKKIDITMDAEGKSQEQLGAEIILQAGEQLYKAEKEVNEFMASLLNMTEKEFSELPITKAMEYFQEFQELEGIADFFKLAGKQTEN